MANGKLKKIRADQRVVDLGLAESKTRAQALIMGGHIFHSIPEGQRVQKAGEFVAGDAVLLLKGETHPWVSRGGIKLDHGLQEFHLSVGDKICLDVGASTGGFTDVLLHNGASHVYAVDVGHGQLAWKLRNSEKVTVLEKTNARYLTSEMVPQAPDIVVCDASFISLKTVLPKAMELAKVGAYLVALIKPQFEAGRENVGTNGVVRDPEVHERVCTEIKDWLMSLGNWEVLGIATSPITGPAGNVEFLIGAHKIG